MLFRQEIAGYARSRQCEVAQNRTRCGFLKSNIGDADRTLLLVRPGMALQVIVEGFILTIEVLYIVEFFKATDRDGQLSVPHGPNEGFGRLSGLPRRELGETIEFFVIPMNIDMRQSNFRCNALQSGKNEDLALTR